MDLCINRQKSVDSVPLASNLVTSTETCLGKDPSSWISCLGFRFTRRHMWTSAGICSSGNDINIACAARGPDEGQNEMLSKIRSCDNQRHPISIFLSSFRPCKLLRTGSDGKWKQTVRNSVLFIVRVRRVRDMRTLPAKSTRYPSYAILILSDVCARWTAAVQPVRMHQGQAE